MAQPFKNKTFTIGLDCRLAGLKHAGIGRYIENFLFNLAKLVATAQTPQLKLVLFFANQQQATDCLILLRTHEKKNLKTVIVPIRHYSLKEQLLLPKIFAQEKLDLLHVPHFNIPIFYPGKIVITIHDLLWHEQKGLNVTTLPPWQYYLKYFAYKFNTLIAVFRAKAIFVPADTIKKTIIRFYPWAKDKILVTDEGLSQSFRDASQNLKQTELAKQRQQAQNALPKQLIYTGSLYPHKNLKVIIQALKNKNLADFKLVVVGSRNVFQDQVKAYVQEQNLTTRVEFCGYLSDKDLIIQYQKSYALVQPSLSEGFGLTGIEAMAVGLPVICSNIPIFHEVYQKNATFFQATNPDDFAQQLLSLYQQKQQKHEQQQQDYFQIKEKICQQYSWKKMAQTILNQYYLCLN